MGRNKIPGYGKKARKMANAIDEGKWETLGISADPQLGADIQNIDAISVDSALANSPEQAQAYRDQQKRQARQDAGIRSVQAMLATRAQARGQQAQAVEGYYNRDIALTGMASNAHLQGYEGYYQPSGWSILGQYLLGGANAAANAWGRRG